MKINGSTVETTSQHHVSSEDQGCTEWFEAMSERDFRRLGRLIQDYCGICLSPAKRTMLEGRIGRRLKPLGFTSYHDYCEFLFSAKGMAEELTPMIDAVTTNKTDFFREPWQFDFLRDNAVPELAQMYGAGISRRLNVWSVACSTGEEPYTLAMVLATASSGDGARFDILATDISSKVLEVARTAVYDEERIAPVPINMRKKHLLKSRDHEKGLVKIAPELRERVSFRKLNLMDSEYAIPSAMDVIFCRNVIIYFDRATQEKVINRLWNRLIPGGYLFTGHSENLSGMKFVAQPVAASTYRKPLRTEL